MRILDVDVKRIRWPVTRHDCGVSFESFEEPNNKHYGDLIKKKHI